jgi:hypothetical protein
MRSIRARVPSAHENQRRRQHHAAGEAGQQEPARLGELHGERDGDRDQRQAWNADNLHGRKVDGDWRKLLAHDALL